MSCNIDLTTITVNPYPIVDFVCHTCELDAPDGVCSGTGESIGTDDSRRLVNTYLREEYR